jgi:transcription antitermination factor NusA-like protein
MKMPICSVCLNSELLCRACEERIKERRVSEIDVNVARFVYELSKSSKSLSGVEIRKVLDLGKDLVIVCGKGDAGMLIGKSGSIVNKIEEKFKKKVKIIEDTDDIKKLIEKIVFPFTVSAINVLYTSEGEELKVMVKKRRGVLDLKPLEKFLRVFKNKHVRFVQEN